MHPQIIKQSYNLVYFSTLSSLQVLIDKVNIVF